MWTFNLGRSPFKKCFRNVTCVYPLKAEYTSFLTTQNYYEILFWSMTRIVKKIVKIYHDIFQITFYSFDFGLHRQFCFQ